MPSHDVKNTAQAVRYMQQREEQSIQVPIVSAKDKLILIAQGDAVLALTKEQAIKLAARIMVESESI